MNSENGFCEFLDCVYQITMVGYKIRGVAPSPGEAWSDLLVWSSGDTIAAFSDTPGMFMRPINTPGVSENAVMVSPELQIRKI